jgi:glycosyltransferase involved in cell wall biosynthesis
MASRKCEITGEFPSTRSEESAVVETQEKAATIVESKPFIVVGVPAFNEEQTVARIVLEAQKHVDMVVVCDDGSTDLTAEIARRLGAEVIRHQRNLGYGAAIQSLFKRAREVGADVLVTLDADGQHAPHAREKRMTQIIDEVV